MWWVIVHILRKRPTIHDPTTGFLAKWRLMNDCRNSHTDDLQYPDLCGASDWLKQSSITARPIRSTTQIWVVTRHQYRISAVVPQTSFRGESVGYFFKLLFKEQTSVNLASTASPQFHLLLPIHCFPSWSVSLSPVRSPVNQAHCEKEPDSRQHWIPVHRQWWSKSQEHCWQLTRALAVEANVHCVSIGGPLLVWAQTRR